ncbi:MAG: hypothetical protein WC581_13290, partial [Thermodesulfovibrionales bacterium]
DEEGVIINLYLLDLSILVIFVKPQAWQTETAFVDQAVVKFIRGPTSIIKGLRTRDEGRTKKLSSAKFSGSNVSDSSQRRIFASSPVRGDLVSMLKQYSVSMSSIEEETLCFARDNNSFFFAGDNAGLR